MIFPLKKEGRVVKIHRDDLESTAKGKKEEKERLALFALTLPRYVMTIGHLIYVRSTSASRFTGTVRRFAARSRFEFKQRTFPRGRIVYRARNTM